MLSLPKTLFIILTVIVAIAAVGYWFSRQPTEQVRFSINRSAMKQGENATITVTVENHDLFTHVVEYRFNVSHRVLIYEGAEKLLQRTSSGYTYNHTLEARHSSETNVFVAIGTLEEGISSATYPISLSIYFDGAEIEKTWGDLTLKVEE